MTPPLDSVVQWNALALRSFRSPYLYTVHPWFFDPHHLVYDIGISTGTRQSRLRLVYCADRPQPLVDVLEVSGSWSLLNAREPSDMIEDWILFGWRHTRSEASTIARAILWAGKALEALHAESILAGRRRRKRQRAPQGLLVIHNTRQRNWESICQYGFGLRFSRFRRVIWVRPPSFGKIVRSRFTGNLSFLIDIGGLSLLRTSGYEIVVGEDIPLSRIQRIFDLDAKEDA